MNSTNDRKRKRNLLFAVATIGVSSVFAFIVAEIAVRLVLPHNSPDTIKEHSLEYIPSVYARHLLKPVDRLVDIDEEKAWGTKSPDAPTDQLLFISENGYRGPSFDVRNKANKTRIIVLGGSAVFDQNVLDTNDDIRRAWPHLIEKHLHKKGFHNAEVINAGVPGHSSADSLGRLFSQLWTYGPDVILVYQGWNDIKFWRWTPVSPEHPLITHVQPFDEGSNPFTTYQGTTDRLLSHSQFYVKLRNRYYSWKTKLGSEGATSGTEVGLRAKEYSEFGPKQFRLNLELIVSASRAIGAKPVLISQATLAAASNTDADIARIKLDYQNLSHTAIVRAYEETYTIIEEVGTRTNTLVIDAAGIMNGNSNYFVDHVHTSAEGSAKLAQIVADKLAVTLLAMEKSPGVPTRP